MRITFIILILIAVESNLYSQKITISGVVKDAQTGAVLPYTNIQVAGTNLGTAPNHDGQFKIIIDSLSYTLTFSHIGYKSKTINVNSSQLIEVMLNPIVYELGEVLVGSLTWADKFILEAIKINDKQNNDIQYYNADAYSKSIFTTNSLGIFGLSESVSQIQYIKPNLYKEKLTVYKVSPNLKSVPYKAISVNQNINLLNQSSIVWNFYIINPLSQNVLDYYDFYLKGKSHVDGDTVVILSLVPKKLNIPLFEGDLYFIMNSHRLIEANLTGNKLVKDATFDSLRLYQKYSLKDSIFNLPSFTKYSAKMNFAGLNYLFQQEYVFMNYSINKKDEKPYIIANSTINAIPNLNMDIEFKRDELFKVPLTSEEEKFNKKMEDVFVNAPFYKKIFLYLFTNIFPFFLDQPTNVAGYNISRFSNLYRFNKTEGHYLGIEHDFFNSDNINLFSTVGYTFGLKELEFDIHFRWNQLSINFYKIIKNLGNFQYLQSMQTLNGLLYHKDDLNYFKSSGVDLRYAIPLSSKIILTPFVNIENQKPLSNSTEFSIFKKNELYKSNFHLPSYSNNFMGLSIEYLENKEYSGLQRQIFKGQSFTNIVTSFGFGNKEILNTSENFSEITFEFSRYQEIYNPLSAELQLSFRHLNGSEFINKMSFVNYSQVLLLENRPLSFYTLKDYDFYLRNFFKIKSDLTLFTFPHIFGFQISFGGLFTFLRPLDSVNNEPDFQSLKKNFYEFGISLKGISFINLYFLKNNLDSKNIFVRVNLSF